MEIDRRLIDELMQPGSDDNHWMKQAPCGGDDRFTQKEPPDEHVAELLGAICSRCEVFAECFAEHNYPDVQGVWVAGEWRADVSDS